MGGRSALRPRQPVNSPGGAQQPGSFGRGPQSASQNLPPLLTQLRIRACQRSVGSGSSPKLTPDWQIPRAHARLLVAYLVFLLACGLCKTVLRDRARRVLGRALAGQRGRNRWRSGRSSGRCRDGGARQKRRAPSARRFIVRQTVASDLPMSTASWRNAGRHPPALST